MRRHVKASSAGSISGQAGLLGAVLAMAMLLLGANSALAAEVHPLKATFGSFSSPSGIGIDKANGNVFVADGGSSNTVGISGPEGGPPSGVASPFKIEGFAFNNEPSGVAIDNSATSLSKGALYVTDVQNNSVKMFTLNGSEEYELKRTLSASPAFREPLGVVVDAKGNVYVADYGSSSVVVFNPTGTEIARINFSSAGNPSALAFDSAGSLYVQQYGGGAVFKYAANGSGEIEPSTVPTQIIAGGVTGIAVDQSTNILYAAMGNRLEQYSPAGALTGTSGVGSLASTQRVAVSPTTGEIYVVDRGAGNVAVFSSSVVIVPDPITGAATEVKRTTATLHGTVNAAGGPDATCEFQYTSAPEDFAGASSAPCSPAGPFSGNGSEAVTADISGLDPETTYRFRLVGTNENGANPGAVQSFETASAVNVKTGSASNLTPTSATLNGTIRPEGFELEACAFEYGEEASTYGEMAPCVETPAQIGSGDDPVAVHADISGLSQIHVYHFRLVAKNSFGTTNGADSTLRTTGAPEIHAVSVSGVTLTSASFEGLINPDGEATSYHFEYVTETEFETNEFTNSVEQPVGGEAIGSGNVDTPVAQGIDGLTPLTTYHARLVATNAKGTDISDEIVFTTYREESPGLPDGRAYEQATPLDKGGSDAQATSDFVKAAAAGGGITFYSKSGQPGGEGSQQYPTYLSTRAANGSGWSTQGLLPPASNGSAALIRGFSDDLSKTYVTQAKRVTDPATLYERDNATHALRPIVTDLPSYIEFHNLLGGATADGSQVLFELTYGETAPPGAATNSPNTFVWDKASGALHLVGVMNDEQAPAKGTSAGSFNIGGPINYTTYEHPISSDGSRVFFTAMGNHEIYMRLNPTRPQSPMAGEECTDPELACTVHVSASKRTVAPLNDEKAATLWSVTPEGSQVFFTSAGKLTNDATPGPEAENKDLYRYDTRTGELIDLVPDGADPKGADLQGVVGVSDDGSYVYFVANGVLAPGATLGTCDRSFASDISGYNDNLLEETNGDCNLYLWHEGTVSFIARQHAHSGGAPTDAFNWVRRPRIGGIEKTGRVTPDGQTLLFTSRDKLTSYDNRGDQEIYLYSAGDGDLTCVSCNPAGTAPVAGAELRSLHVTFGVGFPPVPPQTRNLSVDGKRVFFESPDKLVESDTNGDEGCTRAVRGGFSCQDVYEWEAEGSGSCHSHVQNGGCLYLLSSGTSPDASYFADASLNGNDAFIFTVQPLVRQDQDQLVDVYDARVGGGIVAQNEPPPPICEGEACKGQATPPPVSQSPGSAAFTSSGNPKPVHHRKKKAHKHRKKHSKGHHKGQSKRQQRSASR